MMVPRLAAFDVGALFTLVIFLFVIISVIRATLKRAKEEQEENRRREAQPNEKVEKEAHEHASEIEKFLQDLARQSGLPAPPRQAPPKPQPSPVPRPAPSSQRAPQPPPVAKRPAPAPAPKPPATPRRLEPKPPATAHPAIPTLKPHIETHIHPASAPGPRAPALEVAEPMAAIEARALQVELAAFLKHDRLKEAVILREVFGPCRAMRRYRPSMW